MPTCNLCRELKGIEEMKNPFRYVCKDCWKKLKIYLGDVIVNKDMLY